MSAAEMAGRATESDGNYHALEDKSTPVNSLDSDAINQEVAKSIALAVPHSPGFRTRLDSLRSGNTSDISSKIGKLDHIGSEYKANQDTITQAQEEAQDWHESLYRLNCEYDEKEGIYFAISTRLPRRVMSSINLKRIGDVEMRTESFRALFHVYMNWLPTREEYQQMQHYYFQTWGARRIAKWLLKLNKREHENKESEYPGDKYPEEFVDALLQSRVDGYFLHEVMPDWEKVDEKIAPYCGGDTDDLLPADHPFFRDWDGFWNEFLDDRAQKERELEQFRLKNGAWRPQFVPRMEPRNTVNIHHTGYEDYPLYRDFKITKFKKFSIGFVNRNKGSSFNMDALRRSYWIRQRINFDVTFSEELELDNFPFDYQDLTIPLRENSNASRCVLTPELRDGRFFACDPTGFALQEYKLVAVHLEVLKMPATRGKVGYSAMIIRVKMKRNWWYYIWRVAIQMMLITGLSLCAFSLDHTLRAERLAYLVTLVLTAVSFQTVIQSELPNTPYMTRMDEYILLCFLFMTFITVESAFLHDGFPRNGRNWLVNPVRPGGVVGDTVVMFLCVGVFVAFHVLYLIMITLLDSETELSKIDRNPLLESHEKQEYFQRKPVKFKVNDTIERLSTDKKKEWFRYAGRFYPEEVEQERKPCWDRFCGCLHRCVSPFTTDYQSIPDLPQGRDYCQCAMCTGRSSEK